MDQILGTALSASRSWTAVGAGPRCPCSSGYRRHDRDGSWPGRANRSAPSARIVGEPVIPSRLASSSVVTTCRTTWSPDRDGPAPAACSPRPGRTRHKPRAPRTHPRQTLKPLPGSELDTGPERGLGAPLPGGARAVAVHGSGQSVSTNSAATSNVCGCGGGPRAVATAAVGREVSGSSLAICCLGLDTEGVCLIT